MQYIESSCQRFKTSSSTEKHTYKKQKIEKDVIRLPLKKAKFLQGGSIGFLLNVGARASVMFPKKFLFSERSIFK